MTITYTKIRRQPALNVIKKPKFTGIFDITVIEPPVTNAE